MPSTENCQIVTPTPSIDELQDGDRVTYTVKVSGGWLHPYTWTHDNEKVYDGEVIILEVQREVKPKFRPGSLAIIKPKLKHYPRFVAFRGRPGTGDDWNFAWTDGDLDSFRDLGVESAIPAVAVPKAEWDELVSGIRKPGISLRAAALVEAWKEATGNE